MRSQLFVLAFCGVVALTAGSSLRSQIPAAKVRIGTYDSRAIAVAYAPSKYNPVAGKMRELAEAKAAGDAERIRQLEAWGEQHQRALHRQGFARVPVDDLLAHVKQSLPQIAAKARVVAMTMQCDYVSAEVELVDVTDELVSLFDPSEKTRQSIKELRKRVPIDLDEIEQGHEH